MRKNWAEGNRIMIRKYYICNFFNSVVRIAALLLFFASLFGLSFVSLAQTKESDCFFAQGVDAFNRQDYHEAISCFEKTQDIDNRTLPAESPRLGYADHWLARCYFLLGDTVKAKEITPIHYEFEPIDRRLTIDSDKEDELAVKAMAENNIPEAIEHALKCIALEEKKLGPLSLSYIGSCLILADLYGRIHDFKSADEYCKRGLASLKELNKDNTYFNFNLNYIDIDNALSQGLTAYAVFKIDDLKKIADYQQNTNGEKNFLWNYHRLKAKISYQSLDFDDAYRNLSTALDGYIEQYTPDNEDNFGAIYDCVSMLLMLNAPDLSDIMANDALEKLKRKNLKNSHHGLLLTILATYNDNLDQGVETLNQAASLLKDSEYTDAYYNALCQMANNLWKIGDVSNAFGKYREICGYYEKNNGKVPVYYKALLGLGDIFSAMGDYERATINYEKVLLEKSADKNDPDYILTFLNWMPVYLGTHVHGDFAARFGSQFELGQEFSRVLSNIDYVKFMSQGYAIPDVAYSVYLFFHTLLSRGVVVPGLSWQFMETRIDDVLNNILIRFYSEDFPVAVLYRSLFAHVKFLLGKYDEAIAEMNRTIDIATRLGWNCDNFLHDLGYYQYDSGDTAGAYRNFEKGYQFNKERILAAYRWMTLAERTKFTDRNRGNIDNIPHYAALTPDDPRYAALGYDALLFSKGLLLNSSIELSRLLREEGDAETLALLERWKDLNRQLESIQEKDMDKAGPVKAEAEQLEKTLLEKSKTYGDYTNGLTVTFRDVQKGLGPDDVAIEFFLFPKDARSDQYGALLLTRTEAPRYVEVAASSDWRGIDLKNDCYNSPELFEILFRNLKPYLPEGAHGNVYFAPAGVLHTIAIEYLPGAENYNMKRLSSTREIALKSDSAVKVADMALFGGISYGIGDLAEFYAEELPTDDLVASRESGEFLVPLPGTAREAEYIAGLLSKKIPVHKYMADKATEEKFKDLDGRHIGLIHIGTHGYFNPDMDVHAPDYNPLLSSGLYFAGAQNTLWESPEPGMTDDGILNSHEISMMDLRGLQLTVLSACETASGRLNPDGVFGLQRGFKQAGARSILMSLWKVDDKATQLLMTEFYGNLLEGDNQYEALRKARLSVRDAFPNPRFWAAFILVDADNTLIFE